jgi:hypothetical protein
MKKKEVPQDKGLTEGKIYDIYYALDENGNYTVVPTSGWQPKTDAMLQAWDIIREKTEKARQQVIEGNLSPIAYFMEKNIMDLKLLSEYVGLPKRKVKKHLQPRNFNKLDDELLKRYAETFRVEPERLRNFNEPTMD